MAHDGGSAKTYVFGHSDLELDRLKAQARLIDPIANSSVLIGQYHVGAWSRVQRAWIAQEFAGD